MGDTSYISTGGFEDIEAFEREAAKAWENAADVPQGTYSGVTPAIIPGEAEYNAYYKGGKANIDQDLFAPNAKLWDADAEYLDVALAVLDECRMNLMVTFRFMDAALWRLPFVPMTAGATVASDGAKLYFSAGHVVRRYQESQSEMVRDFLHTLLHCIFRHPFDADHDDASAWGLACDVVVETIAQEMCANRFPGSRDAECKAVAAELKDLVGVLTPFKLYRLFSSLEVGQRENTATGMTTDLQHRVYVAFVRDAHEPWAVWRKADAKKRPQENQGPVDDVQENHEGEKVLKATNLAQDDDQDQGDGTSGQNSDSNGAGSGSSDGSSMQQQMDGPQQQQGSGDDNGPTPRDAQQGDTGDEDGQSGQGAGGEEGQDTQMAEEGEEAENEAGDGTGDKKGAGDEGDPSQGVGDSEQDEDEDLPWADDETRAKMQDHWTEIAKQMEMDLLSYSSAWGDEAGSLMTNLKVANRRRGNYRDFLRQFSRPGEDIRVNDDEFDYIFYMFGLEHYGNMPLVEPLEYQETERIREFIIALDTSGSTSGPLIKEFVCRTYDILSEPQGFGDEICVHIVQCDRSIQSDTVITSLDEMKKFRDEFWVKGMGGTDFRPVFEYVDELREQGQLRNLRGLIYFTDGVGMYPETPPDYQCAFVFVDEAGLRRNVPPWAMKVVMDEDEIRTI